MSNQTRKYIDALQQRCATQRRALEGLLDRYTALVNSGDCGFWNPEEEAPVIAAREALSIGQDSQITSKPNERSK